MIKSMSAELMATIIGTAVTVITLAVTIYLTNRSTMKIIEREQEERGQGGTKEIIERGQESTKDLLERLTKVAESTHELQKGMSKCMFKIAFWGKNTLKALNWDVREGVESREEAEKYDKPIGYTRKLK